MLLLTILKNPDEAKNLNELEWELLVRQARAANLLGRLGYLFELNNVSQFIDDIYLWHFTAARQLSEKLKATALREVDELKSALNKIDVQPIFLKGAAYILADLPCHHGRLMSDIDLLVKKESLSKVQNHLLLFGWVSTPIEDYDRKYYRTWMHEIPPLQHASRKTTLDVHHNILPLTNKNTIDPNLLNVKSIYHSWCGNILTLDPVDAVIHSSVHLFTESEFHNALRDLSDLDMLIRHFKAKNNRFIYELVDRANELKLGNYLALTLRYTSLVLSTPIDSDATAKLNKTNQSAISTVFWDFCFMHIFTPIHAPTKTWKTIVASNILYWRGHMLRMPLKLLIPHLLMKSYMQIKDSFKKAPKDEKLP